MNESKTVCIRLPTDLHKLGKMYALEIGSTFQDLVAELIEEELKEYEICPISCLECGKTQQEEEELLEAVSLFLED